jgi:hypothetical protein
LILAPWRSEGEQSRQSEPQGLPMENQGLI